MIDCMPQRQVARRHAPTAGRASMANCASTYHRGRSLLGDYFLSLHDDSIIFGDSDDRPYYCDLIAVV